MKVSELIADLQEMQAVHGDLDVTIHATYPNPKDGADDEEEVVRHDSVFVGFDGHADEPDKIDIRSFLY